MKAGGNDALSERREVVFVGVGHLFDDAVGSQSFDESGALRRGKVG